MNKTIVYVVRHGQTDGNLSGKLRGSAFDDHLNETGIQQVKATARGIEDKSIDICYCSPMTRTRQTCDLIYNGNVIFDERLKPRKYGQNAGGDLLTSDYWNRNKNLPVQDGECILDFKKRVFEFLTDICKSNPGKNILNVTHTSVCFPLKGFFLGLPANGDYVVYSGNSNCQIQKFEY